MTYRDAILVSIAHVARVFPEEGKRDREWRRMAESAGIEIVENELIAEQRRQRLLAAVEAEFGDDG